MMMISEGTSSALKKNAFRVRNRTWVSRVVNPNAPFRLGRSSWDFGLSLKLRGRKLRVLTIFLLKGAIKQNKTLFYLKEIEFGSALSSMPAMKEVKKNARNNEQLSNFAPWRPNMGRCDVLWTGTEPFLLAF